MSRVSELEGAVLGLVWAEGPCTPYAVRRVFQQSPSPHWSGSAGAIYPLVRRLESRGLIRSRAHATGGRASTLYRVTPAGMRALRGWLEPPLPETAIGVPVDPLRTRLRFLGALAPAKRAAFLAHAEVRLEGHLAAARRDLERRRQKGDRFDCLMARGAILMLRARIAWVREAARYLAARSR